MRKLSRSRAVLALTGALLSFISCSRNNLSDRDVRRDQIRNQSDNKRRELLLVAGSYRGTLTHSDGATQNVSLKLDIKDIPTVVEGQVDPLMIPTLSGYLRFDFGGGPQSGEYIGFGLQKAEFDPKRLKLDLVATNNEYKDVVIGLVLKQKVLEGTWTAPAIAATGTMNLVRDAGSNPSEELKGEYSGILLREEGRLYQYGHLTVRTAFIPPEGVKVSAVLRVIFGDWKSSEYLTYRFEQAQFNPVTGQFILKSDTADVMFSGKFTSAGISGEWFSSYTGVLGAARFKKSSEAPTPPSHGILFEALRGTYQGALTVTNPNAAMTDKVMVSFVTSQDLTVPNGIKVTGTLRLYVGPFGSLEYKELPFSDIQYNFFTRKLVAKTTQELRLTVKGDVELQRIRGKVFEDALGEVGDMEIVKQ